MPDTALVELVADRRCAAVVDPTAAARVVRQLLEALLFEDCLDAVAVPHTQAGGHTFYFTLGRRHFQCSGRIRGFGRISLDLATLVALEVGKRQPVAFIEMLHWLIDAVHGDPAAKQRLLDELLQTVYWSQWNRRHLPAPLGRRTADNTRLETLLWEGHPYHPCFKARSGFSESDHRQYSPECARPFQLHWLAVPRRHARAKFFARENTPVSSGEFYRELPDWPDLERRCTERAVNLAAFLLVPVHPWQWCNCLQPRLQAIEPAVVDLGAVGDFYVASQSVRTLINVSHPGAPDVKLPLNIVCTSSVRYLIAHGVCLAPEISRWLAESVAADPFFATHPLVILREFAGALVEPQIYGSTDPRISQWSAIWRDNITAQLHAGEQAVPMTALFAIEADGAPFIEPWIETYGLGPWLRQLLRVVVLPVWHLLARQGIAVEAHAQNALLLHRDGWPLRLALRDFHESVEYCPDFIAAPEKVPDFAALEPSLAQGRPNDFYWMDSVEALRELYMDTLYIYHLSELANLCQTQYGLAESEFWQRIAQLLDEYAAGPWCAPHRLARVGQEAKLIQAESLVRKKLWQGKPAAEPGRGPPAEPPEYHHLIPNPFAAAATGTAPLRK